MSMDVRENILKYIGGQICQGIMVSPGEILILFLGDVMQQMSNNHPLRTRWRFWIDCAWRIHDDIHIIAGCYDDLDDKVLLIIKKLEGAALVNVEHKNISHDLELIFDNGMRIELFSDATGSDLWELRGSDGYRYTLDEKIAIREWMSEPDR